MAGIVTCSLVGEALIRWLQTATQEEKDALCEALDCSMDTLLRNCAGEVHANDAQVPSCAEMDAAIDTALDNYEPCLSGDAGNQLELRDGCLYFGTEAPPEIANLYVSPSLGNDANAGTRAAPLATIEEAVSRHSNTSAIYTIHLRSGEIHVVNTLNTRSLATLNVVTYDEPTYQDTGAPFCLNYSPELGQEFQRAVIRFEDYVDGQGEHRVGTLNYNTLRFRGIGLDGVNNAGTPVVDGAFIIGGSRIIFRGVIFAIAPDFGVAPVVSCPNIRIETCVVYAAHTRTLIRTALNKPTVVHRTPSGNPEGCGTNPTFTTLADNVEAQDDNLVIQNPMYYSGGPPSVPINYEANWELPM